MPAADLMEVSELEQDMATTDDQSAQQRSIIERIADPAVTKFDALRLVLLFALRYETGGKASVRARAAALPARPPAAVCTHLTCVCVCVVVVVVVGVGVPAGSPEERSGRQGLQGGGVPHF